MAILLKESKYDLRKYLREGRNQLYENARPQEALLRMATDVAKGMAYLTELKVGVTNAFNSLVHKILQVQFVKARYSVV